jgi:hypothetical protein
MDRIIDRADSQLSGSRKSYSASTNVKSLFNIQKNKKHTKPGAQPSSPLLTPQNSPNSTAFGGFVEL